MNQQGLIMQEKWAIRITAGLFLAFLLYVFFPVANPNLRPVMWNIQTTTNQLQVLGLSIGSQNLQDAISIINTPPDIALFTTRHEKGEPEPAMHLEAYFDDLYDEGDRIIIGLVANSSLLQHIKKQAFQPQLFPNNVIRVGIHKTLIPDILELPIQSITIITGRSIMFEDFKAAFGEPEKLLDDGQGNAHFLYPALGLDFIQPANGAQLLQFVAPEAFDKVLLQPLLASFPEGAIQ